MLGIWLTMLLLIPIFGVRAYLYEPYRIPAASMEPALPKGSHIVVQKYGYGNYGAFGYTVSNAGPSVEIKRGDILVFQYPLDPKVYYVKRVIGLPGDDVVVAGARLFINGTQVKRDIYGSDHMFDHYEEYLDGTTFKVMNDNRHTDKFARRFKVPLGSYFMMGDNRDYSNDSRHWGYVPAKNIAGKVVYVF